MLLALLPTAAMAQAGGGGGGCDIVSATSIAFGAYDPMGAHLSASLDSAGSISISCHASVKVLSVAIDQGTMPAAGSTCAAPRRQMVSGQGRLRYDIYRDPGRSLPWGCQASNVLNPALGGGHNDLTIPIHGSVPPGQDPAAGSYSDTLVITLTF